MLRRTSLLCSVALVVVGLSTAPAQAGTPHSHRAPGVLTEVRRADVPTGGAAEALRRESLVSGEPATQKYSVWSVSYVGFESNPNARKAFQKAVDVWAGIVHSSVTIKVKATFKSLSPGLLGQAGPDGLEPGPGGIYYPDALADALASTDVYPQGTADIDAEFNSTEPLVYYGLDGNPGPDEVDFMSIVLHELGHGLGLTSAAVYDDAGTENTKSDDIGYFYGSPDRLIYDTFLVNGSNAGLFKSGASNAIAQSFTAPVYWNGTQAVAANGGNKPRLYSPTTYLDGSSIAHLDESIFPNGSSDSLMTPYLENAEAVHRPGPVTAGILRDLGWEVTLSVPSKVTGVVSAAYPTTVQLAWSAPSENGTAISGYKVAWIDNGGGPGGNQTVASTQADITGLTLGHTYVFQVSAINDLGQGPVSDAVVVTTLADSTAPVASIDTPPTVSNAAGTITFTGSDPGHPNGRVSFVCGLDTTSLTPCTSPYPIAGTTTGTHTFYAAAVDAAGNETNPPASVTFDADVVGPATTLTAKPSAVVPTNAVAFSQQATDDRPGTIGFLCRLDTAAFGTCAATKSFSGLADGNHVYSVRGVDQVGNQGPIVSYGFRVDTKPPVVTTVAPPIFTTDTRIGLRYSASDPSGVSRYDVRYRKGQFTSTMSGYGVLLAGTTATSAALNAQQGFTYCFSVRAYDTLNHLSAWSGERCIATTLDDRSLAASSRFGRATASVYYDHTVTQTNTAGQTLTRPSVQARRVAIVATTCSGCGTVGVYFNGALIRVVSLNAASTTYRRVIAVADFGAPRAGTLVIKTLNTGRTYIDGVAFNRG